MNPEQDGAMGVLAQHLSLPDTVRVPARVLARFTARASDDGLVDVATGVVDTPIGSLIVAVTRHGLVRVAFGEEGLERVLEELAATVSPRVLEVASAIAPVRRQLDDYFSGRRVDFDLAVDWQLVRTPFWRAVLEATAAIPSGEVRTYSEVALAAHRPRAQRAAGNALAGNPVCVVVPCHRVVPRGGGVGNYGGGPERKRWLLEHERGMPTR